jgi:hypothetical protein
MNIFDMRGPEFLAVYLLASVVGLIVLWVVSRRASSHLPSGDARRLLRDPYLLAYLRGGAQQTLKTVAFSLSERGPQASVTHPLEVAVLAECESRRRIGNLLRDKRLKRMVEEYAAPLKEWGLLADDAEYARRLPAFLAVAGVLLAISVIKIRVALQGGHSNIAFLVLLTVVALVVAIVIFRRRRTRAGDRALADQRTLFAPLKGRVKQLAAGGATQEAALIAAAFGMVALPAAAYPFADAEHRQSQNGAAAGGGSADGGGGDGGGSSAGCGGCGGGCGGGGG